VRGSVHKKDHRGQMAHKQTRRRRYRPNRGGRGNPVGNHPRFRFICSWVKHGFWRHRGWIPHTLTSCQRQRITAKTNCSRAPPLTYLVVIGGGDNLRLGREGVSVDERLKKSGLPCSVQYIARIRARSVTIRFTGSGLFIRKTARERSAGRKSKYSRQRFQTE